ncbi:MAG: efflux RND transporter permease subunit [Lachnospiraceae bacterium]
MPKFSVKKPYTVIVAVLAVLIIGVVALTRMETDLLPDLSLPYVVVVTTYPGATPEEVEEKVTRPIEASMATLENIENITSTSSDSYSMVMLEFNDNVNMDSVTIDTREKLDQVEASFTDDMIGSPTIMKISMDMLPVTVAAVDMEDYDIIELTKLLNNEIVPKLEGVSGIASVSVSGGIEKTQNVVINEEKVNALNEKIEEIVKKQLDEMKEQLDTAQAELEAAQSEMTEQSSTLEEGKITANQQILEGKLELLKMELKLSQSESDLSTMESEIALIENLISTLTDTANTLQTQVDEQQMELIRLETELAQKQSEYDSRNAVLQARKEEINTRLEEIQTELDELNQRAAELTEELNNSSVTPSISEEDNTESSEQEETTHQSESSDAELEKLEAELEEVQGQIQTLQEEQNSLQEEQITLQEEEVALAVLQAEITVSQYRVDAQREVYNESCEQLNKLRAQIADSQNQLAEAKVAVEQAKTAIAEGQGQLTDSKDLVNEKEKDTTLQLDEAGDTLNSAAAEIETALAQVNEQLDNYEETRKQALEAADLKSQITVDMLSQLLVAQNFSMPAGYATENGVQTLVRVGDVITDQGELENMILFDSGIEEIGIIRLIDVADVYITDNSGESYARVNQNDALIISIEKQNNYATAEVAHSVQAKFEALQEEKEGLHFTTLMDQGQYIDLVVNSVVKNLLVGAVLAIIVLILFLKDIRPTVIIACSIPLSVVFAIILMYFTGINLNIISLSGLAVGIGMLVDNSVVVIENIYRLRNKGVSRIQAAVSGASQVAGAIIASTLTTICVFLPIVFVEGLTRQLFVDMALTIGYSLGASLLVALTLVPMMASRMLTKTNDRQSRIMDRLKLGYENIMSKVLRHRVIVLVAAVVLLMVSAVASLGKGMVFMPSSDSTQVTVNLTMPEESTFEESVAMSDEIVERILTLEDVETVGAYAGNSLLSMSSGGNISMYVVLKEDKTKSSKEIAKEIDELCADMECEVDASGSSSMDMSALSGSGISIRIKGSDLEKLSSIAKEIADMLEGVEGTVNVSDGIENPSPELRITLDKEKAMKEGLTVAQVYMEIAGLLKTPSTATNVTFEGEEYPIVVAEESYGMTPDEICNYVITVTAMDGTSHEVKLSDIAEITETEAMSSISRDEQVRYVDVTAEIADGYNVTLVGNDVRELLESYTVPDGYSVALEGENETINDAMEQLVLMLILALICIYFVMVAQFQSFQSPFIVMFTIPLAFTGGFLGLYLTGNELSVIAMIGFIMLSGVVVNNGIVLVDYINQLRLGGMEKHQAMIEAGVTRMRPIFMTAITTILGLVGMAAGNGMGADMMAPVAIVTIGGLLYATIMTLFVVPVMYDIFTGKKMKKIDEAELALLDE